LEEKFLFLFQVQDEISAVLVQAILNLVIWKKTYTDKKRTQIIKSVMAGYMPLWIYSKFKD